MKHLIDKDALVAEIERRYKLVDKYETNEFCAVASRDELVHLTNFINSLEVKEVDLEHEVESYWKQCDMTWCRDAYSMTHIRSMLSEIAKHFFELGMAVNNKAQKGE
jgi:hypothetical protein